MWKQLLVHIDFDRRENMEVTEDQKLFGFPCFLVPQNSNYVQQKKNSLRLETNWVNDGIK